LVDQAFDEGVSIRDGWVAGAESDAPGTTVAADRGVLVDTIAVGLDLQGDGR
jgi:hypothetical protein